MFMVRLVSGESEKSLRNAVMSYRTGQKIFDHIWENREELQNALEGNGRLLYLVRLGKKARRGDVSVCLHLSNPSLLGEFVTTYLATIPGVAGIRVVNFIDPTFFPLPKDTRAYKRFVVNLDVEPAAVKEARNALENTAVLNGLMKSYLTYKFSGYDSAVQFSVLSENEHDVAVQLSRLKDDLRGIRNIELYEVEATRPLVLYKEWQEYSTKHGIVTSWDERKMVKAFHRT
jgi:hypothetical protein